eukprot:scpid61420/ scgid9064/ 
MMMEFRPGKRPRDPFDVLDQEYRHSKQSATPERITAQMVDLHLDSPRQCNQVEPIQYTTHVPVARSCCSVASASGQLCVGDTTHRQQPVAAAASAPGGGCARMRRRCKKTSIVEEEMPTECTKYNVTSMDDPEPDDVQPDGPVVELSSTLMKGLKNAERLNTQIQDKLVQSISHPQCRQLMVWKPPEDFVQKVLHDVNKPKGPTITEVTDGMDVSNMQVVGGTVVIEPEDDLWDCQMSCEDMDAS